MIGRAGRQEEELWQDLQRSVGGATPSVYLGQEDGVWGVASARSEASGVFDESGGVLGIDDATLTGYRMARLPAGILVYTPT